MSTILITGGHSGLGLETSKQLASRGIDLILAGRDPARIEVVAKRLIEIYGIKAVALKMDISSLTSVRNSVAEIQDLIAKREIDDLQAIVCNAGASFMGGIKYSADGYELTFATNYLGHFLLVQLLLDYVAKNGRIVFVTSGTHDPETRDGKMVGKAGKADAVALAHLGKYNLKTISWGQRYSTSKLCMILLTYELDRRLKRSGKSISSIAFDPGSIPETGLIRSLPRQLQSFAKTSFARWITRMIGVTQGRLDFSSEALAKVVASVEFAGMSGKYLQSNEGVLQDTRSSKASYEEGSARKLWEDSSNLVGLHPSEVPASLRN
ncbi:Glucose/ribitol short chain dehydrogenase/reductase family protein [Alloalcanivorax dieselolei B5]|uniref:Glucose/ribitol short chain dehydrogenase/reductase family protein n=1 Tax=Alcanivorax dieselolei (strain DSM 16502 / CGMCC 1.3690 / MCCC 1A00001 / B-5) TaxID=930169 RepID=K0CHF2_ALCDB|nr:SDR family NAD(P)-dependent oxidoreductase [Alloalcanivorax dieselolei]AFT71056.1 Glucose/ribitol short chain dehydrogenase/reductase family protein [Alloalcanivorax dieselolei B5]